MASWKGATPSSQAFSGPIAAGSQARPKAKMIAWPQSMAAAIRAFGWHQPIVVDKDMAVGGDHTRLLAASPRQPGTE